MNRQFWFWSLCIFLLTASVTRAQQNYRLHYVFANEDTAFKAEMLGLSDVFNNKETCFRYVQKIRETLQLKGYAAASVDSVVYDSLTAKAWVYIGARYQWAHLNTDSADERMLNSIGFSNKAIIKGGLNFEIFKYWQEKMLGYYEDNGYPFARVQLDSVVADSGQLTAKLVTIKGPLYKIDSIRVYGKAKISNYFLQRYLGIEDGSTYRRSKLKMISQRLLELPYLKETKPWDITMVGTGSVLNLYIDPKKSSQADFLIGFLPATNQVGRTKLQITGEANINLKNAMGSGETIGVNWQQLQVKSPRLHLIYEQPYIFNSPLGIDFNFDLLKKDSSYLNLNAQFGVSYLSSGKQSGKVFIQTFVTNVLPAGIDTAVIKTTKRLPAYIDLNTTNLGINYSINNTDYRFNPRRGNELNIIASAGVRKIKPNNAITKLTKDASGSDFDFSSLYDTIQVKSYLLRARVSGAQYFKTGQQTVLKTALNAGLLYAPNIFQNEMFQIGGYKLLRGFDEESIFASSYAVITAEYRYFIGLNSYFFGFADGALVGNKAYGRQKTSNNYIGLGIGMAFETKAGIFNLSYAVGKRDDIPLNFRQAKIHFGLISLF